MAQGEQVVGDVHAVVVVDGSQLGQLLQVLPGTARREKEEMGLFRAGSVQKYGRVYPRVMHADGAGTA